MKKTSLITMLFLLSPQCPLHADTFGTGANAFTMDFVPITGGAEADSPDSSNLIRYGAVPYDYRMGKYEVSRAMILAYNASGGSPVITLQDMTSFGGNGVDKPAIGVSWNEAARFVNWLNVSTGHSPAYRFTTSGTNDNLTLWTAGDAGYDPSNPYRNANARYFLPGEDEWYRAAYFDPAAQVFWDFPTGTNIPDNPIPVASGTAPNTAVYGRSILAGPADITQAGGLSPFGTMAQGGNVFEWMESAETAPNDTASENRGNRGGGYFDSSSFLTPGRQGSPPTGEGFIGFRVASKSLSDPVLIISNPRRLPNSFVADVESNVGAVDIYRSTDLINWGEMPIATEVSPGTDVVIDNAPPQTRAFYILCTHGAPPPGN